MPTCQIAVKSRVAGWYIYNMYLAKRVNSIICQIKQFNHHQSIVHTLFVSPASVHWEKAERGLGNGKREEVLVLFSQRSFVGTCAWRGEEVKH